MLSTAQVVKIRKAIESQYDSICTVKVKREFEKSNSATGFSEATVFENEPCHLQYTNTGPASPDNAVANISQQIRLFLSPDREIPSGSKITVNSVDFKLSGAVAKYKTHQEIELDLWDRWP